MHGYLIIQGENVFHYIIACISFFKVGSLSMPTHFLVLWSALERWKQFVVEKSWLQRPIQLGLPCIQEEEKLYIFGCQVTFSRIPCFCLGKMKLE